MVYRNIYIYIYIFSVSVLCVGMQDSAYNTDTPIISEINKIN